ncbi:hypothetical protein, variant [Microbotryum lychnidis-dioicae p1A1 Lamole]|uniref:C2 domain-containing protein n=1 Tax=Microbotryum lychnidis-dioicae (strain p1A1 Lamole / MvSl-1064) TaxID=683840 RepID=U5H8B3_USTV1|nr:hypothetical protein MVLG_03478 [Microbotryum lychnidis-dioicae p1A1 Lamole]KDE06198.1 hypothetical protein, variant [Microbotryum lychnidis-dioicae p1A1 Lamole]|eukprot:KDE06197.1 hypothetical protein MVLG_03478 [Microbotryum lychnidis-dioicae p1A1 Lamole]
MAATTQSQSAILGLMVVIVIRAKNLPNRVKIGKQNPYCTLTYGMHKKRTETVERGGQQPTWDAEFRFEILRDSAEQTGAISGATVNKLGGVASAAGTVSDDGKVLSGFTNTAPTAGTSTLNADTRGRKILKLACWADDPKDPKLVGEGFLELDSTIKKGAFDDWVKLERKGRYAGEVYLELTWYPKDPPPQKPRRHAPISTLATGGAYGGPGARTGDVSDDEGSLPSPRKNSRDSGRVVSQASEASPLGEYPDADLAPLSHSFSHLNVSQSRPPLPATPEGPPLAHRIYGEDHPQAYDRPDAPANYRQPPPTTAQTTNHSTFAAPSHVLPYVPQPQSQPAPLVGYRASYDHFGGPAMMLQSQYPHPIPPRQDQGYAYYQEGATATPSPVQFEQAPLHPYERPHHQYQPHFEAHLDNAGHDPDPYPSFVPALPPRHSSYSGYPYPATVLSAPPLMPAQQGWGAPPAQSPSPGPVAPPRPHSTSSVFPAYKTHVYAQPPQPTSQAFAGYEQPMQHAQHHYPQPTDDYGRYVGSGAPPPPHSIANRPPPLAHSYNDALGQTVSAPYDHAYPHPPAPAPPPPPPSFPPPPPVPSAVPYHAHAPAHPYGHIPPPPSVQHAFSMGTVVHNQDYYPEASGYALGRAAGPGQTGQKYGPSPAEHAIEPFLPHNPYAVQRS